MELLTSIAIIGVVSTWSMASFHKYGRQGDVDMSAQRLASDMRLVQSYAFGLKEYDNDRPEGGWGLYFDSQSPDEREYWIFADKGDGGGGAYNHRRDADEDYKMVDLRKVNIGDLQIDGNTVNEMTITVEPPDPQIWICEIGGDCSATTTAMILLESGEESVQIDLNSFGLVDIN